MSLAQFDISGQKVLVVGAGRGIGKGIALAFAEAGADVAVTSLNPATAGQVSAEIRELGRKALPLTGDATKAADMQRIAADTLREFGHVDTLVNCVGDSIRKPLSTLPNGDEGMTEEEWHFIVVRKPDRGLPGVQRPRTSPAGTRQRQRDQHFRVRVVPGAEPTTSLTMPPRPG